MERIVELSELFIDTQLSADQYRIRLAAAIIRLDEIDLAVLAIILIAGPHSRQ